MVYENELGALSIAAMKDMLQNGKKVVTKKTITEKVVTRTNMSGDVIYQEVTSEHEIISETLYPPSESLIKLCLPPMFVDEALKMLTKFGYVVIDPTIQHEPKQGGISEDTYHEITGRILGVNTRDTEESINGHDSEYEQN